MNLLRMLDKKKEKVIAVVIAFLVVDLVVVIALSKIFLRQGKDESLDASAFKPAVEQMQQTGFTDEGTTEAIYDIYALLIVGNFKLGNDLEFNFGDDGSYNGFFDNDHRFVEGYSYQLENNAGQIQVHIYNEDKSKIVTYIMTLSEETGNIILELPETGDQLELKY